ncbi:MAG TPA: toxin-antitoxin system HicB family antitoxin [Anaerolineaceae bacterium]
MAKTVEYFMSLPYTRELVPDAAVGWGIKIKELPGCMSQGETPEEALRMIEDAMFGWLESEIEAGSPIPEPRVEETFSGKFVVRVPRQLHRLLVESAESNNVSLNQFINVILAQGIEQQKQSKVIEVLQAEVLIIKELVSTQ